jgi:hypothetical protein
MELTSECGIDYASSFRYHPSFVEKVEKIMKLSIITLQTVIPFVSNSQSLSSSYRRINDSFSFTISSSNYEIAQILISMITVGLGNNSKMLMNIMDHIMNQMR